LREGLCDEKKYQECKEEVENIEWTCRNCKKKRTINSYTQKLIEIVKLQKGGYRFKNNDLTPEEWRDLGVIKQWLEMNQSLRLN